MFVSVGGPTGPAGANGADGAAGATGATGPPGPPGTGNCNMKVGTYTGNGVDNRDIDIGINLAAKTYQFVIVKGHTTQFGMMRTEYGQGDFSMSFSNVPDVTNMIQSFTATGFQVGSGLSTNENLKTYRYIAFWVD